jgi:hypothetical protein
VRRRGLADVHEPLAIRSIDADVEVAVRVRSVEDAAGDVVNAQVEPGVFAAGAEPLPCLFDRRIGQLPIQIEAVGIDDHRGDAIETVSPRDVLDGRGARFVIRFRWRGDAAAIDPEHLVVEIESLVGDV